MKIKGTKEVEYLYTKSRNNQIIRVYQVDNQMLARLSVDYNLNESHLLSLPILVSYYGKEESIVDILEERDSLKKKYEDMKEKLNISKEDLKKEMGKRICFEDLYNLMIENETRDSKKWWQFWK